MRTAALVTAPLALIGLGATPAAAGDVERFSFSDCVEWADQTTLCSSGEGTLRTTTTKSGIQNVVLRGTFSERLIGPGGEQIFSTTYDDKVHSLFKDVEVHVFTISSGGTVEYMGQTCEVSYRYHVANGEVRVDRYDTTCV
jgi:hypothetical protein